MNFLKDISVIYNLIRSPFLKSSNHQEKLENFYKHQADNYDSYRRKLLWGRLPMLQTCAAHLKCKKNKNNLVWIDMGGGTGYNVEEMDKYFSLNNFKKIYIVDLCPSLCEKARQRVIDKGWTNVEVICDDVCNFIPPERNAIDIITFSYSLSMIPPFYKAVDNAYRLLSSDGIIGVCDFYVSDKYDKENRQMSWLTRFFWKGFFDIDGVFLGTERRLYLEHIFQHNLYEYNSFGSVPYTPIKAPYYIWIGTKNTITKTSSMVTINKSKAPVMFPPTFLYHQSWEDPREDHKFLYIKKDDVCLTLTAGGCNTLQLLLEGADTIVSVDVNPAQTALLELKSVAIKHLPYNDFWKLFGEGYHEDFDFIYTNKLAPFLSHSSNKFWENRHYYFKKNGLYSHGSMGMTSNILKIICKLFGFQNIFDNIVNAPTLEAQIYYWRRFKKFLLVRSALDSKFLQKLIGLLVFNNTITWFAGGVPSNQLKLIKNENIPITTYFWRCIDNVMMNSHIKSDNYFYYNIICRKYTKDNCPEYLNEKNYNKLNNSHILNNLIISNDFFINELKERKYDKVILMDHVDWQSTEQATELAETLYKQLNNGGKIIFRSAAEYPFYADILKDVGFRVNCIQKISDTNYIDRVNMYASFYICIKE